LGVETSGGRRRGFAGSKVLQSRGEENRSQKLHGGGRALVRGAKKGLGHSKIWRYAKSIAGSRKVKDLVGCP